MDAPVIGADSDPCADSPWQVSLSYRYQKSARHFVGSEEQEERQEEGSEVINHLNLFDLSVRYGFSSRNSVSVSIPFLDATRSQAIRGAGNAVVARYENRVQGMGDVVFTGRRWMLDPTTSTRGNVSLGVGIKLPLGEDGDVGSRRRLVGGNYVDEPITNDQSIQPGDGGTGALLEMQAFRRIRPMSAVVYGSLAYLFNPEATNGVRTGRGRESESIMSIADQYLAVVGIAAPVPGVEGLGVRVGGRLEGVPSDDVFGSSRGFRRPGYAISFEPGIGYTRGGTSFSIAAPVALYRNRVRSFSDRQDDRHGDAAFADWVFFAGITQRF